MRRRSPWLAALAASLVFAGAGCSVHETTLAATSVLGYWSADFSHGTIALELTEQHGTILVGRCLLYTPTPLHREQCPLQVAYVDSTFRTPLSTWSYRWTFDGRHASATEIRGRLTGNTFSGPMDETIVFTKTPSISPLFRESPTHVR